MATTSEDWLIGDSEDYGMLEELGLVDNFRKCEGHIIGQVAKDYLEFHKTVPDNLTQNTNERTWHLFCSQRAVILRIFHMH